MFRVTCRVRVRVGVRVRFKGLGLGLGLGIELEQLGRHLQEGLIGVAQRQAEHGADGREGVG